MSEAAESLEQWDVPGKVAIGLGTPVQVELEGVAGRTPGTLVGLVPERYLVLGLGGERDANYSKLFKGNSIVVRYIFDGAVYGFQTASLGSVTSPDRLLFVSYPSIVAEQSLRSFPRSACVLAAEIEIDDEETPAQVLDLSVRGLQLVYREELEDEDDEPGSTMPDVEDDITVKVTLPGAADAVEIATTVRNQGFDDEGRCRLGVEFEEPDEDLVEAITNYVSALAKVR